MLTEVDKARLRFQEDFAHYASKCLQITTKAGTRRPLILNKSQLYIHKKIEEQLKLTGKVRTLIVKCRQNGSSTYSVARYLWKISHRDNVLGFIMTDSSETTAHIYGMLKRYYEYLPIWMKPSIKKNNAKVMDFDKLNSGYRVSTAGADNPGRGGTNQYLHCSEVAFWRKSPTLAEGLLETVPDMDGTEVILESTANGTEGLFYDYCMKAINGDTDYQVIFTPWFWNEEYRTKIIDKHFALTPDEEVYKREFDLEDEQMYWRRIKIAKFDFGILDFRRTYPATMDEAFKAEVEGALWNRDMYTNISHKEYDNLLTEEGGGLTELLTVTTYDPAVTDNPNSDAHGIMTGSLLSNDKIYIRADNTKKMPTKQASNKVINISIRFNSDHVTVEVNNGGDFIPDVFEMINPNILVVPIHVYKNKKLRSGPAVAAYNMNKVIHVGDLGLLEDEQCSWIYGKGKSPNRIDAVVMLILDLLGLGAYAVNSDVVCSDIDD